jgi:excisionase family DNA binding protein
MNTKAPAIPVEIEPLLTAQQLADYLNITLAAVYIGINAGRLPKPFYPVSRSSRWRKSEVDAALEATRSLPSEARAERRQARIDKGPAA